MSFVFLYLFIFHSSSCLQILFLIWKNKEPAVSLIKSKNINRKIWLSTELTRWIEHRRLICVSLRHRSSTTFSLETSPSCLNANRVCPYLACVECNHCRHILPFLAQETGNYTHIGLGFWSATSKFSSLKN